MSESVRKMSEVPRADDARSLWTSVPRGGHHAPALPSLAVDVNSAAMRKIREAVTATEQETRRFQEHASAEALSRSCA